LLEFSQTCPKNVWATFCANIFSNIHSFRMTSRKNRYSCYSAGVGCHFFHIKPDLASFLPRFSGIWQRFSRILSRFLGILPGFSPNQKKSFWGCACTTTPTKAEMRPVLQLRSDYPGPWSDTDEKAGLMFPGAHSALSHCVVRSWISGVAAFPSDVGSHSAFSAGPDNGLYFILRG